MRTPKFCHDEEVLVIDGFYKGKKCVVMSYSSKWWDGITYEVRVLPKEVAPDPSSQSQSLYTGIMNGGLTITNMGYSSPYNFYVPSASVSPSTLKIKEKHLLSVDKRIANLKFDNNLQEIIST